MSTHGADVRSLVEQQRPGWSLAQPFYVEPAIFEHERRRLLARQWLLMGHSCELPKIGSHIVREALGESLLIIRGKDDPGICLPMPTRRRWASGRCGPM